MKRHGTFIGWLDSFLSWLALGLALAALALAQLGPYSASLDVLSHLTGHLIGLAAAATLAIVIGRYRVAVVSFGVGLTLVAHAALGLSSPRAIPMDKPEPTTAHSHLTAASSEREARSQIRPIGLAGSADVAKVLAAYGTQAEASPARGANNKLKIISFNSWHSNKSPRAIVNYLKASGADVVVLIEFGPSKRHLLRQLRDVFPYQVDCARKWYCSLALISRNPISETKALPPTGGHPAIIRAKVSLQPLRRSQLSRGQKTPAIAARPKNSRKVDAITVVGTHIYRPSARPRLHVRHMQQMVDYLKWIKGPYVVAGDFNATPWSQSYRGFLKSSGLKAGERMLPSWPAWPIAFPQFAIDHMFLSQDLRFKARGIGPSAGSDHLPIWAVVEKP